MLTQLVVLEVDRSERVTKAIKKAFPSINDEQIAFQLGHADAAKNDRLIRSLVEDDLAEIISRPQIMTVAGKKGVIQVGQQIKLPPTKDPNDEETREIGLTIDCTPHLIQQGKSIRLDLHITRAAIDPDQSVSVKGVSYPGIKEQFLTTTVQVKSGETVVFKGPTGKRSLLLFLTATLVPSVSVPFPNGNPSSAHGPAPPPPALNLMTQMQNIKDAMNTVAPGALTELSVKADEFEMEAALRSSDLTSDVVAALGKLEAVEITTVRVSIQGPATRLLAEGRIKQANVRWPHPVDHPRPAGAFEAARLATPAAAMSPAQLISPALVIAPARAASPAHEQLRAKLKELFPREPIEVLPLNQAVLLRGSVSRNTVETIIRIAEDYSNQVINDLKVADPTPPAKPATFRVGTGQSTVKSDLGEQIRGLRDEVNALRTDMRGLIDLIQEHPQNGHQDEDHEENQQDGSRANDAAAIEQPDGGPEHWWLTLPEVIAIAMQNSRQGPDGELQSQDSKDRLAEAVRREYGALQRSWLMYREASNEMRPEAALSAAYKQLGYGDQRFPPSISQRRQLAAIRSAQLDYAKREAVIRELMKLAPNDGRQIIPVNNEE